MGAYRWWSAVALAVALCGCKPASLSDMRPGLKGSSLQCWLTLSFKKAPAGDARDVKVVFRSVVLFQDETFDWEYLAGHDHKVVSQKTDLGTDVDKFVLDDATTAESAPGPGTKMMVEFLIPSRQEVQMKPDDEATLDAELFWGGQPMDKMSRGLFLAYQRR